jgi:hypothetical protein
MINMGQEFVNAMRKNTQEVSARLNILNSPEITNFGFISNSIEPYLIDNEYAILKGSEEYWIRQINNCITNETAKYGIFENDGLKLDGSISLLSKTAQHNEIGWYSSVLSNNYGVFSEYPYLQWKYGKGAISDFNIVFSKIRNEYAVDFDIIFEQYSNDPIGEPPPDPITYNIVGNTEMTYVLANIPFSMDMGSSLKIIIKKWSIPNARAKITDLYFGKMLIYTDKDIVSINGNKEIDLLNDSISSKQINFTVQDINGDYNIFNPQGGLANLNKSSRVALELGPIINKIPVFCKIDEYILGKPKKEKNPLEVSLTGYGRLSTFNNKIFDSNYYEKQTAKFLLESYGHYINNSHMSVDNIIESEAVTIRTQYAEDISLTDGLRKIATAVRGNIIETIDNDVLVTRISESETPISNITLEDMWDTPDITKIDKPSSIIVKTYYPVATTTPIEVFKLDYDIWKKPDVISFDYAKEHTAGPYTAYLKISGVEAQFYPYFMDNKALHQVTDIDNNITNVTVRINANVVEIKSSSFKYIVDIDGIDEQKIDNESIDSQSMATTIFNWIVNNINKQFEYRVEIQDTCTYQLGDTVQIDTNIFVNDVQVVRNAIVTGIDISYAGSLHYTLTLKGA